MTLIQDSLATLASGLLEDEVAQLCGVRFMARAERDHTRYRHQKGVAALTRQKVAITSRRARYTDGGCEVPYFALACGCRSFKAGDSTNFQPFP
jgi:hypothetical protein